MHHNVKSIDCKDDLGLTPLFYASKAGSAINVFELCEKKADVTHEINVKIPIPSAIKKADKRIDVNKLSTINEESHELNDVQIKMIDTMPKTANASKPEQLPEEKPITALYFAKNLDVVDVLLNNGVKPTNQSMINFMNENSDLARAVLDNCLSKQKDEENDKDMLCMDFSIFQDNRNDMSLFLETKDHIRDQLLLHPMIKMFLHMKFFSMYMWALYYAMALYTLLVFSFVALGYTYVQSELCSNITIANETCFETKIAKFVVCPINDTYSEIKNPSMILPRLNCQEYGFIEGNESNVEEAIEKLRGTTSLEQGFFCLSVVIACLVFLYEADQLWSLKVSYFSSCENILQFCLIWISVSFYVFHAIGDYSNAKIIVSWMVLLSCLNFTVVWARVDRMRPYVHMFMTVIKAMSWCMLAFLPALMGFSNAFYLNLNHNPNFDDPIGSIIKSFSMAIGELDYSENFDLDSVEQYVISGNELASSKIMLVIFILGSLMFLNLMVSVAVNDVQTLYNKSELIDMKQKISDIEEVYYWGEWRQKMTSNSSDFDISRMNAKVCIKLLISSHAFIHSLYIFYMLYSIIDFE